MKQRNIKVDRSCSSSSSAAECGPAGGSGGRVHTARSSAPGFAGTAGGGRSVLTAAFDVPRTPPSTARRGGHRIDPGAKGHRCREPARLRVVSYRSAPRRTGALRAFSQRRADLVDMQSRAGVGSRPTGPWTRADEPSPVSHQRGLAGAPPLTTVDHRRTDPSGPRRWESQTRGTPLPLPRETRQI